MNPQWWGDWLLWKGPRDLNVFMTTNSVHVVPNQVWRDYMTVATGQPGLIERLNRYRATTVVVDKERQATLAVRLRRLADWQITYEDEQGFVAVRTNALSVTNDNPLPSETDTETLETAINSSESRSFEAPR